MQINGKAVDVDQRAWPHGTVPRMLQMQALPVYSQLNPAMNAQAQCVKATCAFRLR